MQADFSARRIDPKLFAQAGAQLGGECALASLERLRLESVEPEPLRTVRWRAQGESRTDSAGQTQSWLHVQADLVLPLTCQRCLGPVEVTLEVARSYRFVPTEAQAAAEDESSEEDVLAWQRDFDLLALVEDELLMELPLVPRHAVCPDALPLAAQSPGFDATDSAPPQPFAALAALRGRKA